MPNRNRRASIEMSTLLDMLEESKIKPSLLSKLKKRLGLTKPKPGQVYRRWDAHNETFYLERGAGVTLTRPEQMDGGPPQKAKKKPWQPQKGTYNDHILARPMEQMKKHRQKGSRWADILRLRRNKSRSLFPLSTSTFRHSAVWTYSDLGLAGDRTSVAAPHLAEPESTVGAMDNTGDMINDTTLAEAGTAIGRAEVEGGLDEDVSNSDPSAVSLSLLELKSLIGSLSDDDETQPEASFVDGDARVPDLAAQLPESGGVGHGMGGLEQSMNDTTLSEAGLAFDRGEAEDGLDGDALGSDASAESSLSLVELRRRLATTLANLRRDLGIERKGLGDAAQDIGSSELSLSELDSELEELRRHIADQKRVLANVERTLAFRDAKARLRQQVEPQMPVSKKSMQGLTHAERRGRVLKSIPTRGNLYQK